MAGCAAPDVGAVTCHRGGRVAVAAFVERSEGSEICEMPQITRFLGPVVAPQSGKTETRIRSTHSIVAELLKQVAGHDHVEMTLDSGFGDLAPFLAAGYDVKVHPTFLLDCRSETIDVLWAGLRDKTKNIIRRARERLTVRDRRCGFVPRFYEANLEGADPIRPSLLAPFRGGQRPPAVQDRRGGRCRVLPRGILRLG